MDRRLFLALATGLLATPWPARAVPAAPALRRLKLFNAHTGESFDGPYRDDLGPITLAMEELSFFLRDHHSGERIAIDVGVVDFLAAVMDEVGATQATVLSAYRTRETNAMLARTTFGVADNSQHIYGRAIDVHLGARLDAGGLIAKTSPDQLVVNGIVAGAVADGAVVSFQIRGGMARGTEFLFEIHGDQGDLVLGATTRASMQRQELRLQGAQGEAKELADLAIPAKYRWVPAATPRESPYNVAQLYAKLAERIQGGKPASPGFDAAVTRHRLIDAIVRASETGQKQVP